jgi:hypothetical protein
MRIYETAYDRQAPISQTSASGTGDKQPSKIIDDFKRLSPRERALAVFVLLGSLGAGNATRH